MWMVSILLPLFGGQTAHTKLDDLGWQIIDEAIAAREQLSQSAMTVQYTMVVPHGQVERLDRAYFGSDERFRVDILEDSNRNAHYLAHRGHIPDPIAILIWDGERFLQQRAEISRNNWSVHATPRAGGFPIYNPRWLGVPVRDPSATNPRAHLADATIRSVSREEHILTVVADFHWKDVEDASISYKVDSSRGWFILEYKITEKAADVDWMLRATSIPEKFGDSWFPGFVRYEQWRDGSLHWFAEWSIAGADFGTELPADTLSWEGTDIEPGSIVYSYIRDVPSRRWTGPRVDPLVPAGSGRSPAGSE